MANRECRKELHSLSEALLYDTYIKACLSVKHSAGMSRNGRRSIEHFLDAVEKEIERRKCEDIPERE